MKNNLRFISKGLTIFNSSVNNIGFTPQSNIETTLSNVIEIYVDGIMNGNTNLSTNQISFIDNTSNLCPLSDGPGVYAARSLRNKLNKTIFNYTSQCIPNSNSIARNEIKYSDVNLNYTNQDGLIKFFLAQSKDIYHLKLYDVSGRLVKEVNNFDSFIDVKSFNSGLYIYNIFSETGKLFNGKLNISK